MSGINKAIIVGNLGRDPEMKHTASGMAICNFTVATSENYTDKTGQKVDKTEWHRITTFGKLAEICGQYLHKGKQVYIEGRIQTREWEDKDGIKRYTTEIIANQMQMMGAKDDGQQRPAQSPSYQQPLTPAISPQPPYISTTQNNGPDDDIPF